MQEKTIRQFMEELSSKAHVPGGGAVAALSGACAASLISMVINLTLGKEEYAAHETELRKALAEALEARDDLLDGMRRDAEAFDAVMSSLRLPKETADEKKIRKGRMQEAFIAAASEPMEAMIRGRKLLDMVRPLIPITNPNVVSDLGLAAINAVACSKGALLNVRINLPSIKNEEFVRDAESWVSETQDGIAELLNATLDDIYRVMRKE